MFIKNVCKKFVEKPILRLATFMMVFAFLLFYVKNVMELNASKVKSGKFFADAVEPKVLVLGTSHVLYGIDPEIMDKKGVHDVYNMGGYAQRMPTSYWVLVNALDHCNPEIVVVDVYYIENKDKYSVESLGFMHTTMDAIPLSKNKVLMIRDLFEDKDTQKEFLYDFYLYHNRWETLKLSDLEILRYYSPSYHGMENGCIRDSRVTASVTPKIISEKEKVDVESVGMEYLEKIYDLCQKKSIKLILTNIPYGIGKEGQEIANGINDWAQERDVDYYNMFYDDSIGLDYSTDFVDKGAMHLNTAGAEKVSIALSDYLLKKGYVN